MLKFRRCTHNLNGTYKGDDAFLKPRVEFSGLGVHALKPDETMTAQEYINEHIEYKIHNPYDFKLPDTETLINELVELVRCKMAERIFING